MILSFITRHGRLALRHVRWIMAVVSTCVSVCHAGVRRAPAPPTMY